MTLSQVRRWAREYSRVPSMKVSDTLVDQLINDGQKRFSQRIGGLHSETFLTVAPSFDLSPLMAVSISISGAAASDVTLVSAAAVNQSGPEAAAAIQAYWRTALADDDLEVSFDADEWLFTVTVPGATSISIDSPSAAKQYVDGTEKVFSGTASQSGETWSGSFLPYCAKEVTLPERFVDVTYINYDGRLLIKRPYIRTAFDYSGDPRYYAISGQRIRLWPNPTSQGRCYVVYKAIPSDLSADDDESELPDEYHMALAYYAASKLSEGAFDSERASRFFNQFRDLVREARSQLANRNAEWMSEDENIFDSFRRNYVTGDVNA